MEFATGEFDPIETWTSASNWLLSKRAPIAWPNGDPVAEFMLPKVRLHGDMYPLCGKLMDLPTKGINVITADCLEKNFMMCMKRKIDSDGSREENAGGAESKELDDSDYTGSYADFSESRPSSSSNAKNSNDPKDLNNDMSSNRTAGGAGGGRPSNVPSASDPLQAQVYNKTLAKPTPKEKEYNVVLVKRDRCPSNSSIID